MDKSRETRRRIRILADYLNIGREDYYALAVVLAGKLYEGLTYGAGPVGGAPRKWDAVNRALFALQTDGLMKARGLTLDAALKVMARAPSTFVEGGRRLTWEQYLKHGRGRESRNPIARLRSVYYDADPRVVAMLKAEDPRRAALLAEELGRKPPAKRNRRRGSAKTSS